MYALGHSPIYYARPGPIHRLTDDRPAKVAQSEREHYTTRLRAGHGYDDEHSAAMATLQRAQRSFRNTGGGYWVAEADPIAARHGMTATVPRDAIAWAVLATDGVAEFIDQASRGEDWPALAQLNSDQLAQVLVRIHDWEANSDPDARIQPRAKRHDGKTIVAIPLVK
ncbi:hypothetical protein ACQPZA_04010 [Pseudonocardia xinjiangensis]|uniref:hypothetical protein n=1 Tax=Pseudonocardia xinjiangensis TaxID=75289 RepID=UPI003D8B16F2